MKILGHYEELWLELAGTPDGKLQDFKQEKGEPDEDRIVQYLRDGEELFSAMGAVGDILGSEERILGGDSIFTDGEWIWRGDLWFYLSRYHVRLPNEFLTRVREHGYALPVVDEARLISLSDELHEIL
ncbi:hypothetical protein SAZ_23795 [Streptomyces noursei ZPM]|uniref:Uncharacterized protein n=1 Tax=Streptomyces noursei TaxID=1971 RepID=A0A401R4N8_STRNR|nr:hypothetical protein [Streptomyces noursei]AKA05129.1 hypothetical protein SAZ_23795 [Streptomyces noursei ZPM]EOT05772.1 hypothetical protein K530_01872 [Streptomyces noursei CCRC 11814]EXU91544.1 hypothetical protein P354_01200 [Streptomyces noursei PD-1]UWS73523.1 hypothetical protein N1H47_21100 [Streptomyces noursei]GCB92570.1 hypothetical protein SALB_05337 [Streptomyces noursei]